MSKIVRHQFLGSWVIFCLLCLSIVGIPSAVLYMLNNTIRIDSELENPEEFLAEFRTGKLSRKHAAR